MIQVSKKIRHIIMRMMYLKTSSPTENISQNYNTIGGRKIDDEIEKRQKQINKILATKNGTEQIVLRRACSELKKEYDQYNQLMEEVYNEELLPATIPELLISSVKRATAEMHEINKNLQHTKEVLNTHV